MEEFQVADISQAAASSSQMLIYHLCSDTESFSFFSLLLLPPDLEMQCWKVSVKFLIWKDQELIVNW